MINKFLVNAIPKTVLLVTNNYVNRVTN